MSNVVPVNLSVGKDFKSDFVAEYSKEYPGVPLGISFFHTNIDAPLMRQILNQIWPIAEDPAQFQILEIGRASCRESV